MELQPITYIYLTQLIIYNNRGRVTSVEGNGDFSGMARTANLNEKRGGNDAITLYYYVRMKKNVPLKENRPIIQGDNAAHKKGEIVDIVGGRVMTFGLCNTQPHAITASNYAQMIKDNQPHYIDMDLNFNNGTDSTFVFDVTDKVRHLFKGGIITLELDMDTVKIPSNGRRGSGFDAVVKDYEEETYEIDM